MTTFTPCLFPQTLFACSTSDVDGNIANEVQSFLQEQGIHQPPAWCKQTHGDEVFIATKDCLFSETADAIITAEIGLPLLIRTADCVALMVYDPVHQVIANIHAGWRGITKNIVSKTITRMQADFQSDPADLLVFLSPALEVCCAEFSDPFHELPAWMHPFIRKNNRVDLKGALVYELESLGVVTSKIENKAVCTKCSKENLPSFRRNGTKRRLANMIMMR